jgi:hypothetical protein
MKTHPIPYPMDHKYGKELDLAIPPTTESEQQCLRKDMSINYRQVIGTFI